MAYEHTPVTVDGKTAVVVGGTSGIGQAIARGFAAEGADVVATSRDPEAVAEAAADLRAAGADTVEQTVDVTDRESLVELRETVASELGGTDVLVNSAGAIARKPIREVTESEWRSVLDVQLDGVYRTIQVFAREMESGSVVNVSSMAARLAMETLPAYSAAKGGLEALTRVAARDLAPDVRVNAVAPGYFITPLNRDTYAEGTERREVIDRRTAMGRVGEVEELVGAAVYLASDAASYTTGEVLTVDGGFADGTF